MHCHASLCYYFTILCASQQTAIIRVNKVGIPLIGNKLFVDSLIRSRIKRNRLNLPTKFAWTFVIQSYHFYRSSSIPILVIRWWRLKISLDKTLSTIPTRTFIKDLGQYSLTIHWVDVKLHHIKHNNPIRNKKLNYYITNSQTTWMAHCKVLVPETSLWIL